MKQSGSLLLALALRKSEQDAGLGLPLASSSAELDDQVCASATLRLSALCQRFLIWLSVLRTGLCELCERSGCSTGSSRPMHRGRTCRVAGGLVAMSAHLLECTAWSLMMVLSSSGEKGSRLIPGAS